MITFRNTIILVKDLKISRHFYETILGLKVEKEDEAILFFENHLVIHDSNELLKTVFNEDASDTTKRGSKNMLIYFETDNIQRAFEKVVRNEIELIHPIKMQAWNQQVFRFYDPDEHMIEIGEVMPG